MIVTLQQLYNCPKKTQSEPFSEAFIALNKQERQIMATPEFNRKITTDN